MTSRTSTGPDRATLAAFAGVVVFGGINAIAVKWSVVELDPFWSGAARFLLAAVILLGVVLLTGRQLPRGRSLTGALLYGGIAFAGSFGFIYPALKEIPAATAVVFLALVPLETFGLAILQGQERFRIRGLLGALMALGGVAVVVANQVSLDVPLGPMLSALAGTLFIAEGAVILKWVPRSDPFATNAVAMACGGAVFLALSAITGESWAIPAQPETWLALGYLVTFGSVVLFGLYVFALGRWTASAVSYTTLLMPLVGIPVAALLLSEQITPSFALGGALAIAGVYVGAFTGVQSTTRPSATASPECLPIENCGPPGRSVRQAMPGERPA